MFALNYSTQHCSRGSEQYSGQEKEVDLVMAGGTERMFGFNGLTEAQVNEDTLLPSLENARLKKFI